MKIISSLPLAQTWKSGYGATAQENEGLVKGSPYENTAFQA